MENQVYLAEFIGTALLIVSGNGVLSHYLLKRKSSKIITIIVVSFVWALSFVILSFLLDSKTIVYLNPAATIGLIYEGVVPVSVGINCIISQMLGATIGQIIVYCLYDYHIENCKNPEVILRCHCPHPSIKSQMLNFSIEAFGSFILVSGLFIIKIHAIQNIIFSDEVMVDKIKHSLIETILLGLFIFFMNILFNRPLKYSLNPLRNLMPRLFHSLVPIKYKNPSYWRNSIGPILGTFIGSFSAILFFYF